MIATVIPPLADTKKATKDKVAPADMPKNSLLILNLATGDQTKIDRDDLTFQLPSEDSGWFTYRPEAPKPAATPDATPAASGAQRPTAPARRGGGPRGGGRASGATTTDSPNGAPFVIRNLATGKEQRIENVGDASISKDGTVVALHRSSFGRTERRTARLPGLDLRQERP